MTNEPQTSGHSGSSVAIGRTRQSLLVVASSLTLCACVQAPLIEQTATSEAQHRSPQKAAARPSDDEDDRQIIQFLTKLKRVVDEGLLDQPSRIEDVMEFRVTGWRERADDDAFALSRHRTEWGSFGGLAASWRRQRSATGEGFSVLSFGPVHARHGTVIKPGHLTQVFGAGFKQTPPKDFHRIGGGAIVYSQYLPKPIELTFEMSGGKNYEVSAIYASQITN